MNSDKINPFENKEPEERAALETKINPYWENEIKNELSLDERMQYLKDKYGYFINFANTKYYQSLDNHFDPAYGKLPNLILKLLLTNFTFSGSFISHLIHYTQNMAGIRQEIAQTLQEADFLRRHSSGYYMVNPGILFKGTYQRRSIALGKYYESEQGEKCFPMKKDCRISRKALLNCSGRRNGFKRGCRWQTLGREIIDESHTVT